MEPVMADLTQADKSKLSEMIERDWVKAALARNWDASMALCADDFVYMPQDSPALQGKAAAKAFLDGFPPIRHFSQTLHAVSGDDRLAVLRGSFEATLVGDGQDVVGKGKFLGSATKRGGQWLISVACFNWDAPPAPQS
jgi:ketosteroid isomerase-like protein